MDPTPDPRLVPYTHSNEVLPDELIPPLNNYLDELLKRVVPIIDERIEPLEQILAELKQKKREVLEEARAFKGLKSAVRRLPPEIIACILRIDLKCGRKSLDSKGRKRFAQLREVCASWRQTGLSTPDLWRSLSVNLNDWNEEADRATAKADFAEKVGRWFSRAGRLDAPLQLDITQSTKSGKTLRLPDVATFITDSKLLFATLAMDENLLSSGSNRKALKKTFNAWKEVKNLSLGRGPPRRLEAAFPKLESLHVQRCDGDFSHSGLRSLFLTSIDFWDGNTGLRTVLGNLPRLEELVLMDCEFELGDDSEEETDEEYSPRIRLTHPTLQRFTLLDTDAHDTEGLLESLEFPSLTLFRTDILDEDGCGRFIDNSKPQHLTLDLTRMTREDWDPGHMDVIRHVESHRVHVPFSSFLNELYKTFKYCPIVLPATCRQLVIKERFPNDFDFHHLAMKLEKRLMHHLYQLEIYTFGGKRDTIERANSIREASGVGFVSLSEEQMCEMLRYPECTLDGRNWVGTAAL
ncbi:hypothetical protein BKA70DRAFT_1296031 [Coprinopsis sp. MPI-PUGE-AT-0042]|nr:hypothetical protein BKA70DRAFT_1296031 [Coprinopsis sp. MPI-PUGE-AT-0042]